MGQFNRIAVAVLANNFANDTALYTAAVEDARAGHRTPISTSTSSAARTAPMRSSTRATITVFRWR